MLEGTIGKSSRAILSRFSLLTALAGCALEVPEQVDISNAQVAMELSEGPHNTVKVMASLPIDAYVLPNVRMVAAVTLNAEMGLSTKGFDSSMRLMDRRCCLADSQQLSSCFARSTPIDNQSCCQNIPGDQQCSQGYADTGYRTVNLPVTCQERDTLSIDVHITATFMATSVQRSQTFQIRCN